MVVLIDQYGNYIVRRYSEAASPNKLRASVRKNGAIISRWSKTKQLGAMKFGD